MFSNFLALVIYHVIISDALIKTSFWVFLKIAINLRKPLHGIVIIQFSTGSLALKTTDKKEENYEKSECFKNQKSVLGEWPTGLQLY